MDKLRPAMSRECDGNQGPPYCCFCHKTFALAELKCKVSGDHYPFAEEVAHADCILNAVEKSMRTRGGQNCHYCHLSFALAEMKVSNKGEEGLYHWECFRKKFPVEWLK